MTSGPQQSAELPKGELGQAFIAGFLGAAPTWYKQTILAFLILNPVALYTVGPFVTGWLVLAQFIFTLAMALKCYPLQPGGLLALEAIVLGMADPAAVYHEVELNFPVLLLLMFMVAGIYFMQELLLFVFTKIVLGVHSKILLALLFCAIGAFLSAFLDALTVAAVIIAVAHGFYLVFHRYASGREQDSDDYDSSEDEHIGDIFRNDLDGFRAFLRSLMMHGAVGTALGGMATLVGEPQNLLIAKTMGWDFLEFFARVAPVSLPILAVGLITCVAVERFKAFGFGAELPASVREVLVGYERQRDARRSRQERARLVVQAVAALVLITALAFHLAEVGLVGLTIIVLQTAFNGVIEEHRIGDAFREAMPFTALLVVFFGVVAVIHDQRLFTPVVDHVLALDGRMQLAGFYLANGALSIVSDNVFVATVYITELRQAFESGLVTQAQFERLAVAVNAGTNIPSVGTPNGQAAFLFLLTSALAPLIRLSYQQMVWMALPYTITLTVTGLLAVLFLLR